MIASVGTGDHRMNRWRRLPLLMLGLALTVVVGVGVSAAAPQPTPLVPGGGSVAGRGYGQWVAAALQWRLSLPNVTSNRTSCFTAGQHGPVWFLSGSEVNASVITRTCAIPAGRYLMLFAPGARCSTVDRAPFHATTDTGLMRCAKRQWKRYTGAETVTLDGVTLQPAGYVGGTVAFAFKVPAHNNWLLVPGRTQGRMAVYGAASILRPLSPGTHRLVQIYGYSHTPIHYKVTYQLTVG
jgi:hypothetical protein